MTNNLAFYFSEVGLVVRCCLLFERLHSLRLKTLVCDAPIGIIPTTLCPSGEIGRRDGFKIRFREE